MATIARFLAALFILLVTLSAPLSALTVAQMKEMEAKVKQLVTKNTPAVVSLLAEKTSGAGSGVVVSADGLILTAAHVTQGNDQMTVVFPDGHSERAKVLGANYTRDLSLVKIEKAGPYPFVEIGDSDKLEPTSMVIALGHPGGYDLRRTPPVRLGRISTKNLGGFLVSDCTLISGDSGGPLFDLEGKVVGIHSSIAESLSFNRSAPVSAAKADWEKLLAGERWGRLGGMRRDSPRGNNNTNSDRPVLGAIFDPSSKEGAVVKEITPQSPLESAGLKAGDVLLKLNGREIQTADQVYRRVGRVRPGDKAELVYRRDGMEHQASVTLISEAELSRRMLEARERKPSEPPAPKESEKTPPSN